jgi:hypothetical protein
MTMRHETIGDIEITDVKNNLQCLITIGSVRKKPTDYVEGVIVQNKTKLVSKLYGSYLGYFEFDGVRYWDIRDNFYYPLMVKKMLPSDSDMRPDLVLLRDERVDEAQMEKERLEETQRADRRLRESIGKSVRK